ncbi:hypothetical protein L9F63_018331, partial [Diploptera punctata]
SSCNNKIFLLNRLTSKRFHRPIVYRYRFFTNVEKNNTVFRQGDLGSSWYAVLGGQLDVRLEQQCKDSKEK